MPEKRELCVSAPEPPSPRPDWSVSFDEDEHMAHDNGRPVVVLALSQEEIDLLEQAVAEVGVSPLAAQLRTRLQLARIDLVERRR